MNRRRQSWLDRYKVFRRLALIWALWLITHATLKCFDNIEHITTPVAACLATVVGILTVVVGLYQGSRHKEDKAYNTTTLSAGTVPSEQDH